MDFHKAGKSDIAYQFYTTNTSIYISASDSIVNEFQNELYGSPDNIYWQ